MSRTELRSGQLITTFGPGAIVDLPDDAIIVGGLDSWSYDVSAGFPVVEEPRLVAKLKEILKSPDGPPIDYLSLRKPPPANDKDYGFRPGIVGYRFPKWYIVQHTITTKQGYRRRRLVHQDLLDKKRFRDENNKNQPVVPVRFVRACKKGHIGDIPWPIFVHQGSTPCGGNLWLEERGTSGDLEAIFVVCDCGQNRSMGQAARMDLKTMGHCDGSRPWLGPGSKEKCGEVNRLLVRSASNAYFPQKMSVISIPDRNTPIDDIVRTLWEDFLVDVESAAELAKMRRKPTVKAKLDGLSDDDVWKAIGRVRTGSGGAGRPVKEVEFEALSEAKSELGSDVPEGDFYARALPPAVWSVDPSMASVERVVLVHRLREVVAQVGFTRFESSGPDTEGELALDVKRAALGMETDWLPAMENRGEGIFLQFKADAIGKWLQRDKVKDRGAELMAGYELWKTEREIGGTFPGMPYYFLHSLSHLLLTAISLECGYPASSLRERVFSMPGQYGILIYTGSSDAEGTLGGLVLAGREIGRHMQVALEMGMLCSNDPVCAYHQPAGEDHQPLLGAACHGCLLVSETSCEQQNNYLDRALVVPTVENKGTEFFQ